MPLSGLSSPPGVPPTAQTQWYVTVLPARAAGKGFPFHAQGPCSSYSSLTRSYRWPISGQEQPGCSFLEGGLGGSTRSALSPS